MMNNATADGFRTLTGTCTVTSERMTFQTGSDGRTGIKRFFSSRFSLMLFLHGTLGLISFLTGAMLIVIPSHRGNVLAGMLLCISGLYAIILFTSRSQVIPPAGSIGRESMLGIETHPPSPPAGYGYFLITFLDGTLIRRQTIAIPDDGEKGNYARAVACMSSNGFLPPENDGKYVLQAPARRSPL